MHKKQKTSTGKAASADTILHGLTPEQRAAVLHHTGPALVLAAPGSGKTASLTRRVAYLVNIYKADPHGILAVTFTNKAAKELRERVNHLIPNRSTAAAITVSTFHSLCARLLREDHVRFGVKARFTICDETDVQSYLKQASARVLGKDEKVEQELEKQQLNFKAVRRFISDAKQNLKTASMVIEEITRSGGDQADAMLARIYARYEQIMEKAGSLDFDDLLFRVVRKLRDDDALRKDLSEIFDFVLVDEYQDTNHAQFNLARFLTERTKNLWVCGDPDQCLLPHYTINTPRGKIAIKDCQTGDEIIGAAGHGDTAIAKIDKVLARPYSGTIIKVRTKSGKEVGGTPEHCLFARLAAESFKYYCTYLMYSQGLGYRIGQTSPTRADGDNPDKQIVGIKARTLQERGDAIWILAVSKTKQESLYWEQYYATKYNLPTTLFFTNGRNMSMSNKQIKNIFAAADTVAGARRLADDLVLSLDHPHHRPQSGVASQLRNDRRNVTLIMFAAKRLNAKDTATHGGNWHQHYFSLCSSGKWVRELVKQLKMASGIKPYLCRGKYWTVKQTHSDYDLMDRNVEELAEAAGAVVKRTAKLTSKTTYDFMPIGNIRPGMMIPVYKQKGKSIGEEEVASVEMEQYKGLVYDLSIPNLRNYIAGGVVVHNSIYQFRGADLSNILLFEKHYPGARTYRLEANFRSRPSIARVANAIIRNNTNRPEKEIKAVRQSTAADEVRCLACANNVHEASVVGHEIKSLLSRGAKPRDFAILYRTKVQSRAFEEIMVRLNIPHRVVGSFGFYNRTVVKDMLSYLRLCQNSGDDACFSRIYNKPLRRLGDVAFGRLCDLAERHEVSLSRAVRRRLYLGVVGTEATSGFNQLRQVLRGMRRISRAAVGPLMEEIIKLSGYRRWLVDRARTASPSERAKAASQIEHLAELVEATYQFDNEKGIGLEGYLEWVTLLQQEDLEDDESRNKVLLMTCHAAKGLEFLRVYVVGGSDSLFPCLRWKDDRGRRVPQAAIAKAIEEERRIFFVATTRAQDQLTFTWFHEATFRGESSGGSNQLSRFIYEAGDAIKLYGMRYEDSAVDELEQKAAADIKPIPDPTCRPQASEPRAKIAEHAPITKTEAATDGDILRMHEAEDSFSSLRLISKQEKRR